MPEDALSIVPAHHRRAADARLQPDRPQVPDLRRRRTCTAGSAPTSPTSGPGWATATTAARRTAGWTPAAGAPAMAAHQLTHTLGASLQGSPNSTGAGSCTDDYDLLCGPDRSRRGGPRRVPEEAREPPGLRPRRLLQHQPEAEVVPGRRTGTWRRASSCCAATAATTCRTRRAPAPAEQPGRRDGRAEPPRRPRPRRRPPRRRSTGPIGGDESDGGGDGPPPVERRRAQPRRPPRRRPPGRGRRGRRPSRSRPRPRSRRRKRPLAAPVQAVLEVREPTSTSVRLTWSAAARERPLRGLGRRRADRHHRGHPGPADRPAPGHQVHR